MVGDGKILGDKHFHINIDLAHDDDVPATHPARCLPAPFAHPSTPSTAMPIPLASCKKYDSYWEKNIVFTRVRRILGHSTLCLYGDAKPPSFSSNKGTYHPFLKPRPWGGKSPTPPIPHPNTALHGHTEGMEERGDGNGKGGEEEGLNFDLTNLIFDLDDTSVA